MLLITKHNISFLNIFSQVTFFNNFVHDPNRPSELELKVTAPSTPVQQGFQGGMGQQSGIQNNQGGWGRGGSMHYGRCQVVLQRIFLWDVCILSYICRSD